MTEGMRVPDERIVRAASSHRERLLAAAERIARVGSWEWEIATNRVTWSDELYRIYGLDPAAGPISFDSYLRRVHPEDRPAAESAVTRGFETGEPFEFEHRIVRPDGVERLLVGRGEVIRDEHGVPVRMVGTGQDVTRQRAAERQAQELERAEAGRNAAEQALLHMGFLADAGLLLHESLDFDETLTALARLAVPRIADWCVIDLVSDNGARRRVTVEHTDAEKLRLALDLQERYPPDPDAPFGVAYVLRTGETQWLAEIPESLFEAAARDETHLQLLRALELRSCIIAPLKTRDRVLGALTLVSSTPGRAYGDADRQLAEELARRAALALENAALMRQLEDARSSLESQAGELEAQTEELEEMMEELEVTTEELAIRNEELRHSAAEAEKARRAADEARRTAEEANRAKAQFLAAMSHELRTPLNAIAGYCELLGMELYGPVTEQQRDAVARVQRNQRHLLALINDVLNFARLEAGKVRFEAQDVPVHAVLKELDALIEPQVLAAGQLYTYRGCPSELTVRGDAERIEQILVNLLSNAVKYTPAGGSIAVGCAADADHVRIHVADTGCGIELDQLETIFEPFVQISGGSRAGSDGVGLGLAISRDLARAMNGDVEAASEPGRGSIFTLVLPRGKSGTTVRSEDPLASRRVEPYA